MTTAAPKTVHGTEETGHQPTVIRRVVDRNRELYCRKCKEHRKWRLLKGHTGKCPFGDCSCAKCRGVLSQRAKAIIRRYRNNSTACQLVLKPVRLGNGNTRLRVFPTHVEENDGESISISPPMKQKKEDKSESQKPVMTIVDAKSGRSDEIDDCSEVNGNEDSTNTLHISPDLATAIYHQDNTYSCDPLPVDNLCAPSQPSASNSWMSSVLLAQLLSYPSITPLLHTTAMQHAMPNSWSTPNTCTSTTDSETSSERTLDKSRPNPNPAVYIDKDAVTSPLLSGERICRNLFLSLEADRSNPMFWPFILTVQKLEETMLS